MERTSHAITEKRVQEMFDHYHRVRWATQELGPAGPGSCYCCEGGGPFAHKAAPMRAVPAERRKTA